jgi:type VI secretion system protein ImpL
VSLVNKNFPNNQQFDWSDACSTTSLTIKVGRFVLEKSYEGPLGFPHFLEDFKTGQKRFSATDFPKFSQQLRESGISFMDVKYQITGQPALLKSLNSKQLEIPRNIAACWVDNKSVIASVSK